MRIFQRYNSDAFINNAAAFSIAYYDNHYTWQGLTNAARKASYYRLYGVDETGHLHFSSRRIER